MLRAKLLQRRKLNAKTGLSNAVTIIEFDYVRRGKDYDRRVIDADKVEKWCGGRASVIQSKTYI